uniref:AlNc14C435G11616 protein n=1 Tax=Albugo laibachii Nc14 TaxID=890382 RepID=F0WZM4_9STRA|nr:AlNc14C435G11616 [Albugo laibachii Nc14]|eukprot:CCA26949.1 AlNc14C435G11616 [Albugo laibachii Nc14]
MSCLLIIFAIDCDILDSKSLDIDRGATIRDDPVAVIFVYIAIDYMDRYYTLGVLLGYFAPHLAMSVDDGNQPQYKP